MSPTKPRPEDALVAAESPQGSAIYGLYMVALLSCGGGNLLIRIAQEAGWLERGGASAVFATLSVIPLVIAAVMFWRLLRSDLDEMFQRIALEGMAFALVVYLPLMAIYVNLSTAGVRMPRLDPPDLFFTPAILVAFGVMLARRRYA